MLRIWLVVLETNKNKGRPLLFPLNDKGVARELTRNFGIGVFWEMTPNESFPIFVGPCGDSARPVAQARTTIKEDDVLTAAEVRRAFNRGGLDAALEVLDEKGLRVFEPPTAPF